MCIFNSMLLELFFFPFKVTQHVIYNIPPLATFPVYYKEAF